MKTRNSLWSIQGDKGAFLGEYGTSKRSEAEAKIKNDAAIKAGEKPAGYLAGSDNLPGSTKINIFLEGMWEEVHNIREWSKEHERFRQRNPALKKAMAENSQAAYKEHMKKVRKSQKGMIDAVDRHIEAMLAE